MMTIDLISFGMGLLGIFAGMQNCTLLFAHYILLHSVMVPSVIRRQMLMQQFTMLKFFMSALSTSKLILLLIMTCFLNPQLAVIAAKSLLFVNTVIIFQTKWQ